MQAKLPPLRLICAFALVGAAAFWLPLHSQTRRSNDPLQQALLRVYGHY
jgi:hypothetical protein